MNTVFQVLLTCTLIILCTWLTCIMVPHRYIKGGLNPTDLQNDPTSLKFNKTDSFTIVQFADLHFGDSAENDRKSKEVMFKIIQSESIVDFAVFSGDQVNGYSIWNVREIIIAWNQALTPVANHKIPFATIFGNHDDQPYYMEPTKTYNIIKPITIIIAVFAAVVNLSHSKRKNVNTLVYTLLIAGIWCVYQVNPSKVLRNSIKSYESNWFTALSRTQRGQSSLHGTSNYYIPVFSKNHRVLMFFLDTGGGRISESMMQTQIEWVKTVSSENDHPNAIAFFHIPSKEFSSVANFNCIGDEETEASIPFEGDAEYPMTSLASAGIKAVFVGHDHRNSWCCIPKTKRFPMPSLCYGRHTGYGGYGDWKKGARIIQLGFDEASSFKIKTWLRMEDGSVEMQGYI